MPERSLICINTCCHRLAFVQAFVPAFALFCHRNPDFDLLIALDGDDADYLDFCRAYQLPVLYSEQREGVGMAKNRVLTAFPDYDHYFFFDDDVELLDPSYFTQQIAIAQHMQVPHFSLHKPERLRLPAPPVQVEGHTILRGQYGGAPINYFSQAGLAKVGGWHPLFAQYRRWGHTEHTYRYWRQGLVDYPFQLVATLLPCFLFHDPPSSTVVPHAQVASHGIAQPEQELIEQKLTYYPVTTGAAYHVVGDPAADFPALVAAVGQSEANHFPLLIGPQRKNLLSLRLLSRSSEPGLAKGHKLRLVVQSLLLAPGYMTKDKISVIKKIIFNQW